MLKISTKENGTSCLSAQGFFVDACQLDLTSHLVSTKYFRLFGDDVRHVHYFITGIVHHKYRHTVNCYFNINLFELPLTFSLISYRNGV